MSIDAISGTPLPAISSQINTPPVAQPQAGSNSAGQLVTLPAQHPKTSEADLHQAVQSINQMMQKLATNVTFSVDKATGMTVVRVVDANTDQVISQLPSKETLAIAQALDTLQGLMKTRGLIIQNKA